MRICKWILCKFLQCFNLNLSTFSDFTAICFLGNFGHPFISARFQKYCCNCNRPDATVYDLIDIFLVCPSGERHRKFSVKRFCKSWRNWNRKREQRFTGHIHFFSRKFLSLNINRKCIGQLHSERKPFLCSGFHQTFQHRNCVLILQVIFEMEIRKCHIIIAKIIHCLSHKFIAKKCRITFYVSINMLLFQKIPHDIFNFLRRTSVHCRKCNGITDFCRNCFDIFFCHMFK